jgi:hypothetical protein
LLAVALGAGCTAGPAATQAEPVARTGRPAAATRAKSKALPVSPDWDSFEHSRAALHGEIERRAAELREGPIGHRGVELASLRLAASGRDLIDAGSTGGALAALERAVSLDGRNGFAYLWLAVVHHMRGNAGQAAEFAASAGSCLPRETSVRDELEGLAKSIRRSGATGSGSAAK